MGWGGTWMSGDPGRPLTRFLRRKRDALSSSCVFLVDGCTCVGFYVLFMSKEALEWQKEGKRKGR